MYWLRCETCQQGRAWHSPGRLTAPDCSGSWLISSACLGTWVGRSPSPGGSVALQVHPDACWGHALCGYLPQQVQRGAAGGGGHFSGGLPPTRRKSHGKTVGSASPSHVTLEGPAVAPPRRWLAGGHCSAAHFRGLCLVTDSKQTQHPGLQGCCRPRKEGLSAPLSLSLHFPVLMAFSL